MTSPAPEPGARLRRHGRRIALGLAAAALCGCAVGPDFKAPDAPKAERYTAAPMPERTASADIAGGDAQKFVNGADIPAQWWALFHSDRLDALVAQALKANPTVEAAQAALRQAHESRLAEQGSLFPSLDGSASGTRQKVNGASFGQPGTSFMYSLFNTSVNVSYALDVFGGVRRQVEAQAALEEYQRFQLEATYLSLSANVVTAAIQQASLRAQIAATQDIIEADRKELEVVKHQFELGGVSRADVLAQQTQLAQEQATLPPLRKQLDQNRNLLAVLAGQLPGDPLDAQFELIELRLPQEIPVSVPSHLVEQRPDVRAQTALLHQASAEVGVATANMLPKLSITGQLGGTSGQIEHLLDAGNGIWSVGAGISQPLFQGGALLHQRRAAVAAYDEAAAQYRGTVLTAFQNVADSLRALDTDADALQSQLQAKQAAAASLELAGRQFEAGAVSYLSLLSAQRAYHQTRIALVQAQAARYADTVALFQSLGGGWWNRNGAGDAAGGTQMRGAAGP
ncbi:MAG: efflux transporter outer membrane subunit [Nevskia sp.]|nr:efflux transporter outer membrane subunit [Nevskia sp.]